MRRTTATGIARRASAPSAPAPADAARSGPTEAAVAASAARRRRRTSPGRAGADSCVLGTVGHRGLREPHPRGHATQIARPLGHGAQSVDRAAVEQPDVGGLGVGLDARTGQHPRAAAADPLAGLAPSAVRGPGAGASVRPWITSAPARQRSSRRWTASGGPPSSSRTASPWAWSRPAVSAASRPKPRERCSARTRGSVRREHVERRRGALGRAVVDQDELVGDALKGRSHAVVQGLHGGRLVTQARDDAQQAKLAGSLTHPTAD